MDSLFEDENENENDINHLLFLNADQASGRFTEAGSSDTVENRPRKKPERKAVTHPPTAEMILESIKELKMRREAPTEAIHKYVADNYKVDLKKVQPVLNRCLKQHVEKVVFVKVKVNRIPVLAEKYKVSKTESVKQEAPERKVVRQKVSETQENSS